MSEFTEASAIVQGDLRDKLTASLRRPPAPAPGPEPAAAPASREELLAMLEGAARVLVTVTTPRGGAYRLELIARIRRALGAETAAAQGEEAR